MRMFPFWKSKIEYPESGGMSISPRWYYANKKAIALLLILMCMVVLYHHYGLTSLPFGAVAGVTNNWQNGGASNNYTDALNWSLGHKPAAGEDVVWNIAGWNCTVNEQVAALASTAIGANMGTINVTVSQATLTAWGAVSIAGGTITGTVATCIWASSYTMSGGIINIAAASYITNNGVTNITAGTWTAGTLYFYAGSGTANVTINILMTTLLFNMLAASRTLLSSITCVTLNVYAPSGGGWTATLVGGANTITVSGATTIGTGASGNGVITFTTGQLIAGGTVTVGSATGATGSLGSATTWTGTFAGLVTINATGTMIGANTAGYVRFSAGLTIVAGGVYTKGTGEFQCAAAQTITDNNIWANKRDLGAVHVTTVGIVNFAGVKMTTLDGDAAGTANFTGNSIIPALSDIDGVAGFVVDGTAGVTLTTT